MNARYYDPTTGRFISQDSYRGDGERFWHLYAYCNGDPVNYTDPTGHAFKKGKFNNVRKKVVSTPRAVYHRDPYAKPLGKHNLLSNKLFALATSSALIFFPLSSKFLLNYLAGRGRTLTINLKRDVLDKDNKIRNQIVAYRKKLEKWMNNNVPRNKATHFYWDKAIKIKDTSYSNKDIKNALGNMHLYLYGYIDKKNGKYRTVTYSVYLEDRYYFKNTKTSILGMKFSDIGDLVRVGLAKDFIVKGTYTSKWTF